MNQTKAAVYVSDGYVPFRTVIGKVAMTCCRWRYGGSGQSLGPKIRSVLARWVRELASILGRQLKGFPGTNCACSPQVRRGCGLAAAFNAPISAVLFVIEEVIGTWSAGALGAIVLAAVSSAVVMRSFLGSEPLFRVPEYNLAHPAELIAYAVLGVVGGGGCLAPLS